VTLRGLDKETHLAPWSDPKGPTLTRAGQTDPFPENEQLRKPMMTPRALVTGASGNVGREVIRALLARGVEVRAATSSCVTRAPLYPEVETARLDLRDPATFAPAVQGCSALFLMRPPAIADTKRTLNPFIDAARAAGIGPVVFLSVAGAEKNKIVPHHAVEAHLVARGGEFTLLRPGFFAQNFGDAYRLDLSLDDRLFVPAGEGLVTFVDTRDLGEVAALALTEPERHRGAAYTLTGPDPVSFYEAARIFCEALSRPIRYEPASVLGYGIHLRRRGLPWGQIAVQTLLHVGLRFGQASVVEPALASLLGRKGRTLAEYARDHVALWARAR